MYTPGVHAKLIRRRFDGYNNRQPLRDNCPRMEFDGMSLHLLHRGNTGVLLRQISQD